MMNKQELRGAFSQIHASEELMQEVLSAQVTNKKTGDTWCVARRVIACAAVLALLLTAAFWPVKEETEAPEIVAMPGVIAAYACEMVDTGDGNITVGTNSSMNLGAIATQNIILIPYTSTSEGLGVTLKVDEEALQGCEITFDISCNYGALFTWEKMVASGVSPHAIHMECHDQALTIQNGAWFYWRAKPSSNNANDADDANLSFQDNLEDVDGFYTKVIVRADGNIVGYAVFEMISMDPQMTYFGIAMRESVFYPKVDGQFQTITEAYIQEQMQTHILQPLAGKEVALGGVYHSARGPHESVDIAYLSVCHGIRYTCNVFDERYADKEITFQFSVNGGSFSAGNQRCGKRFVVGNGIDLLWRGGSDAKEAIQSDGAIYADVIIRADGQVIGYAVIQIGYAYSFDPETGEIGNIAGYGAASCHSVCYPPVDGQLPNLTEEEARAKIEEYKQALRDAYNPK